MMLEDEVSQLIKLEAAKHHIILGRNNVGAFEDREGRLVRFGLFNESKNSNLASSDLIGIQRSSGKLVAIECKKEGWKYKGIEREVKQKAFIDFIILMGGIAGFAQSVEDFKKIIGIV